MTKTVLPSVVGKIRRRTGQETRYPTGQETRYRTPAAPAHSAVAESAATEETPIRANKRNVI